MSTGEGDEKTIKATATAFKIIERIAAGDKPFVHLIANDRGYSRSTVHYHVKTLVERRYLLREDGYRLSLRMANLGEETKHNYPLHGVAV